MTSYEGYSLSTCLLLPGLLLQVCVSSFMLFRRRRPLMVRPLVIPALREWKGGNGQFLNGKAKTRLVVDPAFGAELKPVADLLADDLALLWQREKAGGAFG